VIGVRFLLFLSPLFSLLLPFEEREGGKEGGREGGNACV